MKEYLKSGLRQELSTLNKREQDVLSQIFGLVDGKARKLEEVGMRYNVTRENKTN